MKFIIVRGCWLTNIGNAFVDYGSMASLKMACPQAEFVTTSSFPVWLFYSQSTNSLFMKNCFSNHLSFISKHKSDYAVFSGMVLSEGFIQRYRNEILHLRKKGVEIIINGGGASAYTEKEVVAYRNFMKEIEPYCFISRDQYSYDNFHDLARHSFNGIDCAFFVSDYFKPAPLDIHNYAVYAFDKITCPVQKSELDYVIRAHHNPRQIKKRYLKEENTLISDCPEDYLNLFGNATVTHSDRVHACVATLIYGGRCKLYSDTPRAKLFEKVGLSLSDIKQNVVALEQEVIAKAKRQQVEFLSSVLNL